MVAVVTACAALLVAVGAFTHALFTLHTFSPIEIAAITAFLVCADVVAYHFPIHVRHNSKIYLNSSLRFLMAVLLPPGIALLAIGLSTLVGDRSIQSKTGNTWADDI